MSALEQMVRATGCPEEAEYQRLAKLLMLEGAREFAKWCLNQPADREAKGAEEALAEFAKWIGADDGAQRRAASV